MKPHYYIVSFFLLIFAVQSLYAINTWSITYDEPTFLPEGVAIWKTGEHRLVKDHPPLVKLWSSLPILYSDLIVPFDHPSWERAERWEFGKQLLFSNNPDYIIYSGRMMILSLGILLGIIVYLFSKKLFGKNSALFALFIYSFSPNLIAHSSLITNDLAAACFMILSLFFFWKELNKTFPWKTAISTGLTISAKFTGLYLIPFYFIIYTVLFLKKQKRITTIIKSISMIIIFSFLILIIIYGFNFSALYAGIDNVIFHSQRGHFNFLLGEHSTDGWWYYFPLAFLIKTPLPTLIFLAATIYFWLKQKNEKQTYLLLFILYYFFVFSFNNINIGIRHILPVFPAVFILSSNLINKKSFFLKSALILLSIIYVYGTVSIAPHYLSFFNELAGGPENGHNYLIDSNIDWGQELKLLKQWQDKNNEKIYLAYFGKDDPTYRNISFEWLPCNKSVNGTIVISATLYQGLSKELALCTDWLKKETIKDRIGYSMLVFEVQ